MPVPAPVPFDEGVNEAWLELGLGEHAGGPGIDDPFPNLREPGRTGRPLRVDGHRSHRPQAVARVEVLPRVVEHDESPIADRGERFLEFFVKGVEPALERRRIGPVDARVLRVNARQGVGHRPNHHVRVHRVEPEVHVVLAQAVLVSVLLVHVGVFVLVVVHPFVLVVVLPFVVVVVLAGVLLVVVTFMVVVVVGMLLVVIAFVVVGVIVVPVVLPFVMLVLVPRASLAHAKQRDAFGARELEDICVHGEGLDRLGEERLEPFADPDHEIRVFEGVRIGGSKRPGVGRRSARDEKGGLPDPVHDPCEERVNRLDARHRDRCFGRGCYSRAPREGGPGEARENVAKACHGVLLRFRIRELRRTVAA